MLVFVLFRSAALAFREYYLSAFMMAYTFLYSGHEEESSAKKRFANLSNVIMNPLDSDGVVATSFLQVDFTSGVETRDALSRPS